MPNPQLVSANTNSASFTSGTSATVSSTGTVAAGNLMVVVLQVGGSSAPSALAAPDGTWTTFLATIACGSGSTIVAAIFYKRAPSPSASFSGSFSWTGTATNGHWGFFVYQLQGASLVDGSVVDTQNASGTNTTPSVTPGAGNVNDVLIGVFLGGATGADAITNPGGGFSDIVNIAGTGGGTPQPWFTVSALPLSSAAATGAKTWTVGTNRINLGASFLIQQGPLWGFEAGPTDVTRQLPHRFTEKRAAAIMRGDDGIEEPLVPWFNPGFHIPPPQPPHPRPEKWASTINGDVGNEQVLIGWLDAGWEIPPPQPPHPHPEHFGGLEPWDVGSEAPFVNWQNTGWEIPPPQPPHPRPERWAGLIGNVDFAIFVLHPIGWEIASVQPPHPRPERDAAWIVPPNNIEPPLVNWYLDGFEAMQHQPSHPRPERSGAIVRDDEGAELSLQSFLAYGWEVQPVQPPHPRPEKAAATAPVFNVEATYALFYAAGWEVAPPLQQAPAASWQRWAGLLPPTNVEAAFSPPPSPVVNFEQPVPVWQHPRPERGAAIMPHDDGAEFPLVAWLNAGWPIASFQPPHPRPEKAAAIVPALNVEGPLVSWLNAGFEVAPHQPSHPKPELGGAFARADDGAEGQLAAEVLLPYAWAVQPMQPPRLRFERWAAIAPFSTIEATLVSWQNAGWEIAPPQPPHTRSERSGGLARGDDGAEGQFLAWQLTGFEVAPPQPGHPRPERAGAIAGLSQFAAFVLQPTGFEMQYADQPHRRPQRAGLLAPSNVEVTFTPFFPHGWHVPPPQPPHPKPERGGAIMVGDQGTQGTFSLLPPLLAYVDPALPLLRRFWRMAMPFEDGRLAPMVAWLNAGWEVQSPPPPPRPRRGDALARWDDGAESPLATWVDAGWEVAPPHLRRPPRLDMLDFGEVATEVEQTTLSAWWEATDAPLRRSPRSLAIPAPDPAFPAATALLMAWGDPPIIPPPRARGAAVAGSVEFSTFVMPPVDFDVVLPDLRRPAAARNVGNAGFVELAFPWVDAFDHADAPLARRRPAVFQAPELLPLVALPPLPPEFFATADWALRSPRRPFVPGDFGSPDFGVMVQFAAIARSLVRQMRIDAVVGGQGTKTLVRRMAVDAEVSGAPISTVVSARRTDTEVR